MGVFVARWTLSEVLAYNEKRRKAGADVVGEVPPADPKLVRETVELEVNESKTEQRLNKTEQRFLKVLRTRGYRYVGIQDITLRLAWDTRYTPDFSTVSDFDNSIILWEVKGAYEREDAIIKLKMAATKFPWFVFMKAQWKNGDWIETMVPK